METLREVLHRHTARGQLFARLEKEWVLCTACGHRCKIPPGREGICKVRFNDNGTLMVPHGYVAGLQVDPIEKKPFFHALPGSRALSFGMLGCDYHCAYCQNWYTSQALRDPAAGTEPEFITPEAVVGLARKYGAPILTSTYNEPLITTEWAAEIFSLGKAAGLRCSYVSNGNGTPEVLEYLRPYIDFFKIDLKSFRPANYRQLGGRLDTVLDTIRRLVAMGVWVEVVTLVVPGFNDSDEELNDIADFLVSVSRDIPWHVTAFHQDYAMTDPPQTSSSTLRRAADIGYAQGLHFVYAGNLPGQIDGLEDTRCPQCGTTLIERRGFTLLANRIRNGTCPKCTSRIAGVWS